MPTHIRKDMSRPESLDIYCLVFLFYKDDTQQYIYLKYMYINTDVYRNYREHPHK